MVGILRKLIGLGKPSWSGEEDAVGNPLAGVPNQIDATLDDAIANLYMIKQELDGLKFRLRNEIVEYIRMYNDAKARGDLAEMEIAEAEYKYKLRLYKLVASYTKMLELTISRIRDAKDLSLVAKLFGAASTLLGPVAEVVATISPEAASKVLNTAKYMERIFSEVEAGISVMPEPQRTKVSPLEDPELRSLLLESVREADREVKSLPTLPAGGEAGHVDYEVLEKRMLDYIRRTGGVVRVKEAARELGVTPRVVKEVLYRLQKKGAIKITGAREGTPA